MIKEKVFRLIKDIEVARNIPLQAGQEMKKKNK